MTVQQSIKKQTPVSPTNQNTGTFTTGQSVSRDRQFTGQQKLGQRVGNNSKRVNHMSNNVNGGKTLVNERSKNFTIENLKFLSVNACGLRSKLRFPDFTDLI